MQCSACGHEVLDIDVRCSRCGAAVGATGAHRMVGQVVLGHYELVDVLGQGGMSVVFKGKHTMTGQEVALKILPPELAAHSQVKSRFLEEARALAALDHPNIVHLYNFGQENGLFVLAMQYVQGRTWERIILENERMDWQAACRIAVDVLRALEYAHGRGVIHRDMKPSNVLVRAHDASATVMDFGIAKMTTSTRLTATGQTMGTVRYMSPEQVRGHEVDLRTDVYSLGATLYEAVTGDTPFDGSTHFEIMTKHLAEAPKRPSTLGIALPGPVEDALMRSLAKKPEDRFESARDMRLVLEAALRDGDLGLLETQKLVREVLGEPDTAPALSAVRVATATPAGGLADQLEPGTSSVPVRGGRRGLLLAAAGLVVAGGAAVTLVVLRNQGTGQGAAGPTITEIRGVRPTAAGVFEGVRIETTGTASPAEVASAYQLAVGRLRAFAATKELAFADPVQVHEIVTIPPDAFCEPTAYADRNVPKGCATLMAQSVIGGSRNAHRLLVSNRPERLEAAMAIGVADAVCVFEPDESRQAAVCQMTQAFRAQSAPP